MSDNRAIPISEIFSSVQGEGVYAGMYATFIRIQGCSVHCSFCDEKKSWSPNRAGMTVMDFKEIASAALAHGNPLVVITGGEPLECPDLPALAEYLRFRLPSTTLLQLETSGLPTSALFSVGGFDSICISPKMLHTPASHKSSANPYHDNAFRSSIAFDKRVFLKLVVEDFSELLFFLMHLFPSEFYDIFDDSKAARIPIIYVNPVDNGRTETMGYPETAVTPSFRRCIELAQTSPKIPAHIRAQMRFGLQLHKIFSLQ